MKTEQEIKERLEQASEEMQSAKEWHDQAFASYRQNKKDWGEADFREVNQSRNDLSRVSQTVSVLKWVLSASIETTPGPPQTEQHAHPSAPTD